MSCVYPSDSVEPRITLEELLEEFKPKQIRGINPKLYREARMIAVKQGITIGELITQALKQYLSTVK